jgi:hypothetical protein
MQRSRRVKVPLILRYHLHPQVPGSIIDGFQPLPRIKDLGEKRRSISAGKTGWMLA